MQQEKKRNAVIRFYSYENPQESQRENNIFNRQEFHYFFEIEFASLFEVEIKTPAQDNHNQRQSHRSQDLQNRLHEIGQIVPGIKKLDDYRYDRGNENRIENPVPLQLFFVVLSEKQMIGAEEHDGMQHDKNIELRQVYGIGPEDAADDD